MTADRTVSATFGPPCATTFPTSNPVPTGFLAWTGGCVNGEYSPTNGTWGAADVWANRSTGAAVTWSSSSNDSAYFGGTPAVATPTVTIATNTQVGNMTFATTGYTIGGTGTLNLGSSTSNPPTRRINVDGETTVATISARLVAGTSGTSATNVTKTGAGTLILSGANTYSGTTTVSAGTLQVVTGGTVAGAVTVSPDGGDVLVDGGTLAGAINVNGGSLQIKSGTFSGTGAVQVATGRSIIFNNTAALEFPRAISGSGRLVKQGEGTLTLSGLTGATGTSNPYSTTVEEGRLVLSGAGGVTISGPVTVAGGELALSRQVTFTSLTVGDGGTLEDLFAGHRAATLTLNAGSTLKIVLDPLSTTPNFDVTGTVTLGGTLDYTDTIEEGEYLIIGASDVSGEFSSHPKIVGDYTHSIFTDDAGVTLKVEVKRDPHTVTFVDHDGTVIGDPQKVEHGKAATEPDAPSRAGYRFTGWDVPFDNVTEDITVTAQYIAVWTVTFVNGGTTVATYPNIDDGTPVSSLEEPANPCGGGYNFTGWNFGTTAVTANLTVTAGCVEINPDDRTVRFEDHDGTLLKAFVVQVGNVVPADSIPPNPARDGFRFTGWLPDVGMEIQEPTVFKAQYAGLTYTVRFVDEDGTTSLLSRTVNHGALMSTVTPPVVTPPEGYIHIGWEPVIPDGGTSITQDYTFKAVYEEYGRPPNPLKVYRITSGIGGMSEQFEVAVRGFNALRAYEQDAEENKDDNTVSSIHVWYRPNSPVFTGVADAVPNGGRVDVQETRWPAAGVDTATVTFFLDGAKWASVRDPYYYFNANVIWTPGSGSGTVLSSFHADSSFGYYLWHRDTVMGRYGNTLTLTPTLGTVKPGQPAELNIGNLSSLADFKDPVDYRPHIDSVGIWVSNAVAPSYPSNFAARNTGFVFAGMVAAAGASGNFSFTYSEMPALAAGVPSRDVYFLVAPRWRDASATPAVNRILADSAAGANICKVTISDFPDIPITVSISQPDLRAPSVNVTLVKDPDEEFDSDMESIRIEFSLGGGVFPGTGFSPNTREISCAAFPAAGVVIPIQNDNFVGAPGQLHYRLSTWDIGANDWRDNVVGVLVTGREPPVLPATTSAEPSNDMIRVVWGELKTGDGPGTNNLGSLDSSFVYIRYWEAAGSQSAAVRDSVRAISRNYTTRRLKENTEYQFEVVLADWVTRDPARASWNLFSDTVRVSATTGVASNEPNIVKITAASFNPDSMWFKVVYTLLEDNTTEDELGVSFIVSRNDEELLSKERYKIIPPEGKANDIDSLYIYTDSLTERLVFNTVYDITLFSEGSGFAYRDTEPVTVPLFARQTVKTSNMDTVWINNDSLRLWLSEPPAEDRRMEVRVVRMSGGLGAPATHDFIPVSPAYRYDRVVSDENFQNTYRPFTVSMKATPDSVPAGREGEIRLFRYSAIRTGLRYQWDVVHDTKYDPATGYFTGTAGQTVSLDIGDTAVYRLMINNRPAVVSLKDATALLPADTSVTYRVAVSRRDSVVGAAGTFTEEFLVESNVNNYIATLYYAPANSESLNEDSFHPDSLNRGRVTAEVSASSDRTNNGEVMFRNRQFSGVSDRGLFMFLVVDNGSRRDTVNLSRRAKSDKYSGFFPDAVPRQWRPFAAHVDLDKKVTKDVLKSSRLFGIEEEVDKNEMRYLLYRWYDTPDNASAADKWVEYDPVANENDFALATGQLMWIKTAELVPFEFGSATTVSLVDTFSIALPPGQWTDFVLPFGFDMSLRDIIRATGDNLYYCKWEAKGGVYQAEYIFAPGFPETHALGDSLKAVEGGRTPFSIYNAGTAQSVLRVVPKPMFMTSAAAELAARPPEAEALSKGKSGGKFWHYTIRASTGNSPRLAGVTVGYYDTERALPVPPSLGGESVTLVNDNGTAASHCLTPDLGRGGRTFKLRFTNTANQKSAFTWSAEASANTPGNMQVMFINAVTGEVIGGGAERAITVNAKSYEEVLMIVGNGDYLSKTSAGPAGAKFALTGVSVNQAARSARVRYYIPLAGVDKVEVSIYNLKGAVLWKNTQKVRPASHNFTEWRSRESRGGRVAAGLYIVRVKAINNKGKTVAVENRRFTFAR